MTTGQLRVRVRAWEREDAWAPVYVADALAGTTRAAEEARQEAALAAGRGDNLTAAVQEALAADLDQRVASLEEADEVRAEWYVSTSATRGSADRARLELIDRGEPEVGQEPDRVTAEEWLVAHSAAVEAEEQHRPVWGLDLSDDRMRTQARALVPADETAHETGVQDIRETAETWEQPPPEDGIDRVAATDEVSRTVERARAVLAEVRARREVDAGKLAAEAEYLKSARQQAADETSEERIASQQRGRELADW